MESNAWTTITGSPVNFPLDGEEILLNYHVEEGINSENSQVPFLVANELSQELYHPRSHYIDPILNDSQDPNNILSQGQMQLIESEVGCKGLSDISFGEFENMEDIKLAIFGNTSSSNDPGPGPSYNLLSQKKLMAKEKSASKTLSQEITTEVNSWPGKYNFKVRPTDGGNSKRCIFWHEKNKIYVARDYHIPFKFEMDNKGMGEPNNYAISTMLLYTDSQYRDVPVLRCLLCKSKEKSGPNPDRLDHIVRAQQPHAQYVQKPTNRCEVICRVQKPQAGVEYQSVNFMFSCLSSCKSGEPGREGGMQRRTTAIVFNLLDQNGRVCGRDFFYVRICSAPLRDFLKDKADDTNCPKKRKSKSTTHTSPKVSKMEATTVPTSSALNDDDLKPTSSSQETCYSDEDTEPQQNAIKLRSLMRKVKWALSYKHSDNVLLRCKAKEIFSSVKMTNLLVENMKALADDQGIGQPKPSPDQGYQDHE